MGDMIRTKPLGEQARGISLIGGASHRQGPEVPISGYRGEEGRQRARGAKGLTKRSGGNLGNPVISNLRSVHDF